MHKKKNNKKITDEIIYRFYFDEYDPEVRQKAILSFTRWLTTKNISEESVSIFRELFDQEDNVVSSDEVQLAKTKALVEKIKREYGNVTNKSEEATVVNKEKKTTRLTFPRVAMRVAAVLVPIMIIAAGGWYWQMNRSANVASEIKYAELSAGNGETIDSVLPDSTKVWVNSGGKLAISQSKTERVAELSGESYFDVTKDPDRPFVVKTTYLTVTVYGTEFNVEAYPESDVTTVTLNSGKVVVRTLNDKSYELEPNQQFVYTKSTDEGVIKTLKQFKADEAAEWTQGIFVLDNMPLTEAFKAIERRFNVTIEVTEGTNFDNIITLKYDSGIIVEDVIRHISIIVPSLKYRIEGNKILVSKE